MTGYGTQVINAKPISLEHAPTAETLYEFCGLNRRRYRLKSPLTRSQTLDRLFQPRDDAVIESHERSQTDIDCIESEERNHRSRAALSMPRQLQLCPNLTV